VESLSPWRVPTRRRREQQRLLPGSRGLLRAALVRGPPRLRARPLLPRRRGSLSPPSNVARLATAGHAQRGGVHAERVPAVVSRVPQHLAGRRLAAPRPRMPRPRGRARRARLARAGLDGPRAPRGHRATECLSRDEPGGPLGDRRSRSRRSPTAGPGRTRAGRGGRARAPPERGPDAAPSRALRPVGTPRWALAGRIGEPLTSPLPAHRAAGAGRAGRPASDDVLGLGHPEGLRGGRALAPRRLRGRWDLGPGPGWRSCWVGGTGESASAA
jgi:hypothetical protein